jgi:hypothetical protein
MKTEFADGHNKKWPAPGAEEEAQLLQAQWKNEEDEELPEELKQATVDAPVLQRPAADRRHCLKIDWSCNAQGAVLPQAGQAQTNARQHSKENWMVETANSRKPSEIETAVDWFHLTMATNAIVETLVCWRSINRTMGNAQVQKMFDRTRTHMDC